jgi:hypothetical protein
VRIAVQRANDGVCRTCSISRFGAPRGPVANFSRPVWELPAKAIRPNFWLLAGISDGLISTCDCANAGSAERNSLPNRARKNFATGPMEPGQGWTGQTIGNQQHWRNERGETWRTLPLGDRQQLVIDPAGRSQVACGPARRRIADRSARMKRLTDQPPLGTRRTRATTGRPIAIGPGQGVEAIRRRAHRAAGPLGASSYASIRLRSVSMRITSSDALKSSNG